MNIYTTVKYCTSSYCTENTVALDVHFIATYLIPMDVICHMSMSHGRDFVIIYFMKLSSPTPFYGDRIITVDDAFRPEGEAALVWGCIRENAPFDISDSFV